MIICCRYPPASRSGWCGVPSRLGTWRAIGGQRTVAPITGVACSSWSHFYPRALGCMSWFLEECFWSPLDVWGPYPRRTGCWLHRSCPWRSTRAAGTLSTHCSWEIGVVIAEGRSPRLVLDSSISNVTSNTVIPNHMTFPRISDVIDCAPEIMARQQMIQLTLDVSKAHRRILIDPKDGGMLRFHANSKLYRCITLNFGARASGWYWGRVAGLMVRTSHALLAHGHALWQYVDDLLAWLDRISTHLWASLLVVLFLILGIPMSWHKAALDVEVGWIGWRISVLTWSISIPEEKLSKIVQQLQKMSNCTKVPLKDMQSLNGRLLWLTSGVHVLRPVLIPFYKALHHIPTTMVGMDHVMFQQFFDPLSPQLTLTIDLTHRHQSACQQVKVVRVANTHVQTFWTMHPNFTSNHAEFGLVYRTQHHHHTRLMMRLVKLYGCGRNYWCQLHFRCRCLLHHFCRLQLELMPWRHNQWQGLEVLHFSQMAPVSGYNSRSHWHKPTNTGIVMVWTCKNTSLHGNFWHSSLSQFALNLVCPVVVAQLHVNKGQTTVQPMQLQPRVCRWHLRCPQYWHHISDSWGVTTSFPRWLTCLVIWMSLQTRWVNSSSPFLNHSQWQIAVQCGGPSCLRFLQSVLPRLAESGLLNLALTSKGCRSSPPTVGSLNRFLCWGVLVSGWSIFDLSFGAFLTHHLVQPVCYPAFGYVYLCWYFGVGGLQFDPMGLNLMEPAGIFLVVQSFVINFHHARK